jgi:hypothetical protein
MQPAKDYTKITAALEEFLSGTETQMDFPSQLSPDERRFAHLLAETAGLEHTSVGARDSRRLQMRKIPDQPIRALQVPLQPPTPARNPFQVLVHHSAARPVRVSLDGKGQFQALARDTGDELASLRVADCSVGRVCDWTENPVFGFTVHGGSEGSIFSCWLSCGRADTGGEERAEAWITALIQHLPAGSVGVTPEFLRHFLDASPELHKCTVGEVCGMISGGGAPPPGAKYSWPTTRQPAEICPWSGITKLPGIVVRATAQRQCAYLDLFKGTAEGAAWFTIPDRFVSHSWNAPFHTLVNAVENDNRMMSRKFGEQRHGYWIDIFAKNQWVVNSGDTALELQQCVRAARYMESQHVPAIVVIMHPFPEPWTLTRIWCLFEIMTGLEENAAIEMALTDDDLREWTKMVDEGVILDPLLHDALGNRVYESLDDAANDNHAASVGYGHSALVSAIDALAANATVASDRELILGLIHQLGPDTQKVKREFGAWSTRNLAHGLSGVERFNATIRQEVDAVLWTRWARMGETSAVKLRKQLSHQIGVEPDSEFSATRASTV